MTKNSTYQLTVILFLLIFSTHIKAQNVGINTIGASPDSSAMLDIVSADKGLLIPRMDSTSRKNIASPAQGLMVFDNTYNSFYFYDGTSWTAIGGASSTPQDLSISNDSLFLSNDPTAVDLSAFKQDLQFANDTLTITNGQTPIDLKPLKDNMGDHIATQNVQLKDKWLNNDGIDYEGIHIDTNGYVGINTIPQGSFQVGVGLTAPSAAISQQTGGWYNFTFPFWQSFTATDDAFLSKFDIVVVSGTPGFHYVLLEGEGTGGVTLASGTTTTNSFGFDDIPLQANQKYTVYFYLSSTASSGLQIDMSFADTYSGGMSSDGGASRDIVFTTYTRSRRNGLLASDTGVSFENYTFPLTDGTANQVLSTNGTGTLSWTNHSTSMLEDADQDTKIQVEKNANENIIRFDINGQEKWTMQGNRLSNSQPNLFIGSNAGQSVTTGTQLTALGDGALANNTTGYSNTSVGASSLGSITEGNRNTAVGSQSLLNCTTCYSNTVMGHLTGSFMTSGLGNTLIGYESGRTISTGSSNTMLGMYAGLNANNLSSSTLIGYFAGGSASNAHYLTAIGRDAGANSGTGGVYLGFQAGQNETGNDKLYIDNSNTATPLIWGDFANDTLRVNGTFNINNAFSFPTTDGTNEQVLQTDGAGQLSWVASSGGSQTLNINGNDSLFISGENGVNLSPYLDNTDNQQLTLSSNNLSLTNGGTPISLSPYLDADDLGNHTATQNLIIGANGIQNNSSSANGLSIESQNQLLLETEVSRSGQFKTIGVSAMGQTLGNYIEVNNKFGTRSLFGSDGHGLFSPSDSLNTVIGNWTLNGSMTFHVNGGTKAMTLGKFGRLGIGRTAVTNLLEVEGDASKSSAGSWLANSDARLKKNITSLSSNEMLNKLLSLNGVTYEWNDNKTNTKRPEGIQYGFTAQNIQEVFPTLVTEDNNGFLQTPYGTYDAMTVEAIRALNDKIEELEKENSMLKSQLSRMDQLESNLAKLESLLTERESSKEGNRISERGE